MPPDFRGSRGRTRQLTLTAKLQAAASATPDGELPAPQVRFTLFLKITGDGVLAFAAAKVTATPTRGCSVPTFHGSAADLAAVAACLLSLLALHLTAPASGTHLIALPHAPEPGPHHHFIEA